MQETCSEIVIFFEKAAAPSTPAPTASGTIPAATTVLDPPASTPVEDKGKQKAGGERTEEVAVHSDSEKTQSDEVIFSSSHVPSPFTQYFVDGLSLCNQDLVWLTGPDLK